MRQTCSNSYQFTMEGNSLPWKEIGRKYQEGAGALNTIYSDIMEKISNMSLSDLLAQNYLIAHEGR